MSIVNLRLVEAANPYGATAVEINKQASPDSSNHVQFVATDNELRDIEDRLRQWRLDQYGLVSTEIRASALEVTDVIPCLGMTVERLFTPKNGPELVTGNNEMRLYLPSSTMLTIHRRVR